MAPARRRRPAGLALKLFLSYVVVIVVGIGTVLLVAGSLSPTFFSAAMRGMMGGVAGMMAGPDGIMQGLDLALADAFRAALLRGLLVAAAVALLAAMAISAFVAGRIVQPVRRLAIASRRLATGRYAERVPAGGGDELADLAHSFNDMAAELEAVERRRLELVGDVAHELRTPLATLQGSIEGLLDGVVQASPETWARLDGEVGRLRRLVDDLEELSRAEARQIPLQLQAIAPADVLGAAVELLEPSFVEKGVSLETNAPSSLPLVRADRDRAVQVLTNLLSNALRYTSAPGRVTVTARAEEGVMRFSVVDSGVGLSSAELLRVFERFYRTDRSRSRAAGGSGIGLTISRALVEAMGGRIWAESPGAGQGSTFSFELPLAS